MQLFFVLSFSSFRTLVVVLSSNSTWSSTTEWRSSSKVNVLFRFQSDHEGWNVDNLLTNSNVSLSDQDSGVVDRLGQTQLVDLSLQSSFQEIFNLQSQDVIQLLLVFRQDTDSHQSSDQGVTIEQSLWVLFISGQQVSGSTTNLRQLERNSVDLSLVLQTVFTGQFQFSVQTSRFVWSLWSRVSLGVSSWSSCKNC